MEHEAGAAPTAFSIIIIALAAFVLPMVAGRLRLPAVVVEILFGILVGPSVFDLIQSSEIVGFLAELGFLLLMFLSGFEIDFGKLERQGPGQLSTGLAVFLLTLGLAFWASRQLGHGTFVTLLLATTSVGLVVPTLRGARQSGTALGQIILVCALLADFLTLIGVTIFAMIHQWGVGWKLLNLPLLFLVMALVLLAMRRSAWWYPERFERLFAGDDPEEMGIRASLALMFVFAGLSVLLGVEGILGAFMAGVIFARVFRHRGQLEQKLNGFSYGFLIPIFFINVGVQFDLTSLFQPGIFLGALALIGAAVAVKVVASLVLFVRGFTVVQVLSAGVLLSARLSLVIAVAELGTRLELLEKSVGSQVVLLAVVTSMLSPSLFRAMAVQREPVVAEPATR